MSSSDPDRTNPAAPADAPARLAGQKCRKYPEKHVAVNGTARLR
ncbi:hypothetical protein [Streptomyces sioyaensis]|nr:hypothetical protein [Streptomyces sioyaensis]